MKPGRPKAVRFPILRTEVVNGEETVRTVEDHTAVTCVQCGMPFEISSDTAYVSRPAKKWTVKVQANVSGTTIKTEGVENSRHFTAQFEAARKATVSLGARYLGYSLSLSVNPAKLMGKYRDSSI